MPVLGHVAAGIAVATSSSHAAPRRSFATWTLVLVLLAYLPDVAEEAAASAGFLDVSVFAHSIPVGIAAALVLAPMFQAWSRTGRGAAFVLVLVTILSHDVLDVLQSPDRMPFWPLSTWHLPAQRAILPSTLLGELVTLGPLAFVCLVWQARTRGLVFRMRSAWDWVAAALVAATLGAAATVNELREARERDLADARLMIASGRYRDGIEACSRAEAWPSTVPRARLEYLRGEAWLGLGERRRSEAYYLRAYHMNPNDFWTIADLAVLYASGEKPRASRQRQAEPWVSMLRTRFAHHPALPRNLDRVRRALDDNASEGGG